MFFVSIYLAFLLYLSSCYKGTGYMFRDCLLLSFLEFFACKKDTVFVRKAKCEL